MLQQKRLALEARCGEGNVTAAAMDIEFVKVCIVLRSCVALLAGSRWARAEYRVFAKVGEAGSRAVFAGGGISEMMHTQLMS
jgi:hypothetical protein